MASSSDSLEEYNSTCGNKGICQHPNALYRFSDLKKICINDISGPMNVCQSCFEDYGSKNKCDRCEMHFNDKVGRSVVVLHVPSLNKHICRSCLVWSNFLSGSYHKDPITKYFSGSDFSEKDMTELQKLGEIIFLQHAMWQRIRNDDPKRRYVFQRFIDYAADQKTVNRLCLQLILSFSDAKIERLASADINNQIDFYLELYRD